MTAQALRPQEQTCLTDIAVAQVRAAQQAVGRPAVRMIAGAGGSSLRSAVIGLAAGSCLDRYGRPGEATLQVLSGRVRVTNGGVWCDLSPGDHVSLPQCEHGLTALEDCAVLLTVDVGHPVPESR